MKPPKPRHPAFLIVALGSLNALTPFSIDMYLPSFPAIAAEFHVAVAQVALSVSIYFIGFALGQVVYGPLLDRFGRKRPLYLGLAIYVLATCGCTAARSLEALLVCRFLSALGGSAASVGATAMVRDLFPPEAAPKVFSRLMLVLSVSPLLAPSVGSLVLLAVGWRAIFAILAGIGLLNAAIVAFALPPGAAPDPQVALRPGPILATFRDLLKTPVFFTYGVAGALSFTALFVYVAGSPAIFMDGFKVDAQVYGGIFGLLVGGMIGGGQLNLFLTRRFRLEAIFRVALAAEAALAALFFAAAALGWLGLPATVAFLFAILLAVGVSYPNAAGLALAPFAKNAGSAAALFGFLQLGIGALASSVVGLMAAKGTVPTASTMCLSSALALLVLQLTAGRVAPPPAAAKPG